MCCILLHQGLYLHSFSAVDSKSGRKLRSKHWTFNTYTAHPRTPPFPQEVFIHALTPPVTTQYHCSRNTVFILMSELFRLTSTSLSYICSRDGGIRIYCCVLLLQFLSSIRYIELVWTFLGFPSFSISFYFCLSLPASFSYTRSTTKSDLDCCSVI